MRVPIGARWGVLASIAIRRCFGDAKGERALGMVDVWEHEGTCSCLACCFNIN
ncbi:MAG: hypothetical protein NVV62_00005 [Terricaulis sp.]|nr:hypothetical protein [Terricaulis sp.]